MEIRDISLHLLIIILNIMRFLLLRIEAKHLIALSNLKARQNYNLITKLKNIAPIIAKNLKIIILLII